MMGFWLLLSGHYDFFHIALGVCSIVLVLWLHHKLMAHRFYPDESEVQSLHFGKFLLYIPWLLWQIVLSSLQVAYVILSPQMPVNISLIKFKTKLPNMTSKVILGNSITLTPGTLTIEISKDEFLVHALTDASSAGILDSNLPDHVGALYFTHPEKVVTDVEILKSAEKM